MVKNKILNYVNPNKLMKVSPKLNQSKVCAIGSGGCLLSKCTHCTTDISLSLKRKQETTKLSIMKLQKNTTLFI